jgi:hypothetical protein
MRGRTRPPDSPRPPVVPEGERIVVLLVPHVVADLRRTQDRTGLSKTDIINRALSLYEFIEAELSAGAELIVRRDGQDRLIKLL